MVAEVETSQRLLENGKNGEFQAEAAIPVPAQIYDWKAAPETRAKAQQVQEHNRDHFLQSFKNGLAVLGYERDSEGNGKFMLGRWEEKLSYAAETI